MAGRCPVRPRIPHHHPVASVQLPVFVMLPSPLAVFSHVIFAGHDSFPLPSKSSFYSRALVKSRYFSSSATMVKPPISVRSSKLAALSIPQHLSLALLSSSRFSIASSSRVILRSCAPTSCR